MMDDGYFFSLSNSTYSIYLNEKERTQNRDKKTVSVPTDTK